MPFFTRKHKSKTASVSLPTPAQSPASNRKPSSPTTPVMSPRPLSYTTTSTSSPASYRVPPSPAMSQTSSTYSAAYSEHSTSTGYSSIPEEPVAEAKAKPLAFHEITIELTDDDAVAVKVAYNETIGLSPSNNAGSSLGSPANLFFSQFYQNLFALRPDLEFMFPDIQRQSAALSGIFSAALAMLDNIRALDDVLERLGRRHAYIMGVEPEHFELLGVIFIQTLRDRLGSRFTPNIELTWVKIYSYLAQKMIAAGSDNFTPSSSSPSAPAPAPQQRATQLQVPPPPERPFFPTAEREGLIVPAVPVAQHTTQAKPTSSAPQPAAPAYRRPQQQRSQPAKLQAAPTIRSKAASAMRSTSNYASGKSRVDSSERCAIM
ncbi:hypothetical protein BZA70DRAFT_281565 [Myxozyma melibiosi]|uniref:Globin domain-containing protein n=1 Tax=Myxozyma melibiosi TaxID=54550 RepID=A0ABR1F2R5_9ASCO